MGPCHPDPDLGPPGNAPPSEHSSDHLPTSPRSTGHPGTSEAPKPPEASPLAPRGTFPDEPKISDFSSSPRHPLTLPKAERFRPGRPAAGSAGSPQPAWGPTPPLICKAGPAGARRAARSGRWHRAGASQPPSPGFAGESAERRSPRARPGWEARSPLGVRGGCERGTQAPAWEACAERGFRRARPRRRGLGPERRADSAESALPAAPHPRRRAAGTPAGPSSGHPGPAAPCGAWLLSGGMGATSPW